MSQSGFEFIIPVDRTRYLVSHNGVVVKAWFMCNTFIFDNYRQEKECEIIERIGDEMELFGNV